MTTPARAEIRAGTRRPRRGKDLLSIVLLDAGLSCGIEDTCKLCGRCFVRSAALPVAYRTHPDGSRDLWGQLCGECGFLGSEGFRARLLETVQTLREEVRWRRALARYSILTECQDLQPKARTAPAAEHNMGPAGDTPARFH